LNVEKHLKKTITILPLLCSLVFLAGCNSDSKLGFESFVEKKLADFLNDENAQVASIAIVSGKHNYQNHVGRFPDGTKPNNDTVYEIASITKTYVGLLLAKAVIDKKVNLDEDISVYLTDGNYQNLQYSNKPITLRHLITHRSGLPKDFAFTQADIKNGTAFELIANYSKVKFFEDLSQYQLTSQPGDKYQYSNEGTDLIGYILENVYQQSLSTLITKLITEKSGEKQTKFRLSDKELSNITQGTNSEGSLMPLLSPYSFASGGLTSTTESISSYMQYLLSSPAAEVTLSQTLLSGSARRYGNSFLWNTYQYDSDKPVIYQSGGSMGTSTWLALYPKQQIGIFIVTNLAAGDTQGKLNDIAEEISERIEKSRP